MTIIGFDSIISIIASLASLGLAGFMATWVSKQYSGTDAMRDISEAVKTGASAFLRREFKVIAPIAIGLVFAITATSGVSNGISFA
ncbi:MAG: sodium/proton-translocating pyrophosphatase, partial [Candidatus Nitrosocaldaceae archaeon]